MSDEKSKWTADVTVSFVPIPKEKEAAYWETINYFAEVMFSDMIDPQKKVDEKKEPSSPGEE